MTEEERRPVDDASIKLVDLPPRVVQRRLEQAADDSKHEAVARPRIDAILATCKLVRQELEAMHRGVANETDLDLTAYSRGSAIWLLAGRCLGLLRALHVQVQAGVGTEAVVTGRAIHEATRILRVFRDAEEEELLRLWLDDEGQYRYVKPKAARDANERYAEQLGEAMERAGVPRIPSARALEEQLYDWMSRVAHSRRSAIVESVSVPLRQMAYGYRPSVFHEATNAEWAAAMTTEVVLAVGDALCAFHRQGFFVREVVPLRDSIEAMRRTTPLDEASIRGAAGTA